MKSSSELILSMAEYDAMKFEAGQLLNLLTGWLWVSNAKKAIEICDKIKDNFFLSQNPELMARMRNGYYSLSESDIPFLKSLSLKYLA